MWLQLVVCLALAAASPDQPQLSFEDFFLQGKRSYTEGDWQQCIAFMRRTIEDFRYLEDELTFCRKKCSQQVESPEESRFSQWYFEAESALCVLRCRRERLTELHPGIKRMSTYYDVKERKPYEYLHFCYYRAGELAKATGAAYTFLVANPGHEDVLHALNFYMEQPGFTNDMLIDELALRHEKPYIDGVMAYEEGDWSKCAIDLETAIERILEEDASCRFTCDDKVDWSGIDGNPEISVLMTSVRFSFVRCAQNCLLRLGVINGHNVGNPLSATFEYLHVCYFNLMRGADAMRTVANYLLFDDSPTMRRNKFFYLKQYGKEELFNPDTNIVLFHKQRILEEKFLNFVTERIRYENNEFPRETAEDRKRLSLEVWTKDDFNYAMVESFLRPDECRVLRSPFGPSPSQTSLLSEMKSRVQHLFKNAKEGTVACGEVRNSNCGNRAFVLSIEDKNCGEWLGERHSGCALMFCV